MGEEWVQDPDGGWHQKQRKSYGRLIALLLVLIFVGGWALWVNADVKDSQRQGERNAQEFLCSRGLSRDC